MEKIHRITVALNTQNIFKQKFINEELIPQMKEFRKQNHNNKCFFHRTLEIGPVVDIYIQGLKEEAVLMQVAIEKRLAKFRKMYSIQFSEKKIYFENQESIRRMNGFSKKAGRYQNYTVTMDELEEVPREGEYYSEEAKKMVNSWLFEQGALIDKTTLLVEKLSELEKQKFLVSLFLTCSKKLDGTSYRGYLSFKSHYLGFINIRRKEMENYHNMFEQYYLEHEEEFELMRERVREGQSFLTGHEQADELLHEWQNVIDQFMEGQKRLLKKIKLTNIFSMLGFRRYSEFHKESFKLSNLKFYFSEQFQEYRLLVNVMYLLLPDFGFNTPKRLLASYNLISVLEGEER
ncbi:DNA-binding ferritin-like protein [Enterococcus faecalis]|uniref:hypothetical protein n=1 Tax=Enterococcus faecalis TaxID=1351 RepID=UPI001922B13E|nr:hypothetical protein [Enterococcus faecalis]EHE8535726.1 hypothetical protein [Enterococcus faecalis]EHU8845198.1 hypothetical protein [Enterococcus faecalis]EHV2875825.1 hypothetical protein [Enterococcus faecalis]EIT2384357.1 hypothetical protein [Enterococcus faecalis]